MTVSGPWSCRHLPSILRAFASDIAAAVSRAMPLSNITLTGSGMGWAAAKRTTFPAGADASAPEASASELESLCPSPCPCLLDALSPVTFSPVTGDTPVLSRVTASSPFIDR